MTNGSGWELGSRRILRTAGWGQGTLSGGIFAFLGQFLIFVVAPLACIEFFSVLARGNPSASASAFVGALQLMIPGVIIAGVLLALVTAMAGYHLRRTRARLVLGLLSTALLVIYAFVFFLGGPFAEAVNALGWRFPPLLAFGAVTYAAVAGGFRYYREYVYFGKSREGAEESAPPYRPKLGWGEFDLEVGNPVPGASSAEKYIKGTVIPPVLALLFLAAALSAFGLGSSQSGNVFLKVLDGMAALFLVLGLPLVSLAFLNGYYPKGTRSHAFYQIANSGLLILLIYWIFVASGLDRYVTEDNALIPFAYPMVLAIIIWALLDLLRIRVEYIDERDKWLASVGYPTSPKGDVHLRFPPESRFYDFNLALGNRSRGLNGARKEVLRFIILPEVFILIVIGLQRSLHFIGSSYIFGSWTILVLVGGLLVAFVAFWRGFLPPGSYGRLAVGLLLVPAITLYFVGLNLGGNLAMELKQIGILLYMPGIELLIVILLLLVGFRQVAEFADLRRDWLLASGRQVLPHSPIGKMSRLQEFRVRFASKHDGAVWAGKGMVRYVFYTSIILSLIHI